MPDAPFWRRYLRFLGSDPAADIEDELEFHVESRVADLMATGLGEREAGERAAKEFGDRSRVKAELNEIGRTRLQRERRARTLDAAVQDLRFAVRALRRSPGFSLAAVLILALGIGAVSTIFSIVNGVLLRPLPYPESESILTLWQEHRENGREEVAPANFLDWRERSQSFERLAAIEPYSVDYMGADGPESLGTWRVTEGFFEILRRPAYLGRTFLPEEFSPGSPPVVVLGHGIWKGRFGGDPAIVGDRLLIDGQPTLVVGVMPPEFAFPAGRELWVPKLFTERDRQNRAAAYYQVVGRVRSGVPLDAARAEMSRIAADLATEHPRTNGDLGITVLPLPEAMTGGVRPVLLVLLGAVAFVLLISCVNVANLMLVRTIRLERDFAIRAALGAGQGRVVRQVLTESILLAVIGCLGGLVLAASGMRAALLLAPSNLPRLDAIHMDHRVVLFALLVSCGTVLFFGLAPALHVARRDLQRRLRAGGQAITFSRGVRRLLGALVVSELTLAMVLLVGAGLLLRSLDALLEVDRGYATENVLAASVQAWQYYPTPAQRVLFVQETVERIAALPGIESAGVTSSLPLADGIGAEVATFEIEGAAAGPSEGSPAAHATAATSGYFEALRIPLRRGRFFGPEDRTDGPQVVLVNEEMARRYWPGEDPLGKRITVRFGGPPVLREVVGVVGSVRHAGLDDEPRPALFVPHTQSATGALIFVARTAGEPFQFLPAVREEIWAMNRAMPIAQATTLEALLETSLVERRFTLALLLAFAGVALVLAAVGVYGLIGQEASRRTREIGLRLALGADRHGVVRLVVGQGVRLALLGVALGAVLAVAVTRMLGALLFATSPRDPLTFAVIGGMLVGVAVLSSYLPARKAARVDPAIALRAD